MNRHQTRAQRAQDSKQAWRRGVERIHDEAAGALEVFIIQPQSMPDLLLAAFSGDRRAAAIAVAVVDAVADIGKAAKTATPKLCGSCPAELTHNRYALVIAAPDRDDPTTAIAMGICQACGTTEAGIREKAMIGFRGIWPDLRPITVTHQTGGRA
jgi:hypothetical protein